MAKYIKITQDHLEEIRSAFDKELSKLRSEDGKINFTYHIGTADRKATVYFSETAWLKMSALIRECNKEVGWHGIATRGTDEAKDEYFIHDILVYPQEVTGATVTTDQKEYQTWLYSHEDEVFNNIRMQGHSHVNMGVTPTAVDNELYRGILSSLNDTAFYIFMIWNKRAEKTIKIYDLKKNVLFETADCTVKVLPGALGLEQFLAESKQMVREQKYTKPAGYPTAGKDPGGNYSGVGYSGGKSSYYGAGVSASFSGGSQSGNAVSVAPPKQIESDQNVIQLPSSGGKAGRKNEKRKGKRLAAQSKKNRGPICLDDADYPYDDENWNDR